MAQQTMPGGEQPHILVVDDERSIADFIQVGLRQEGFRVSVARDGPTGYSLARSEAPDAIIMDVMLPGVDGIAITERLRADSATANIPILMLTAKDSVNERVAGLESGADDYLKKPFDFQELVARIRALLRRQQRMLGGTGNAVLRFANFVLDERAREVHKGEQLIELTAKEFNLLQLFMTHPRQVLDRQTILTRIWSYDFAGDTNIIEVYVRYLREKLEDDPSAPRYLQTVRGVGYVLRGA
jgi:two-component system, OmpR family, response regulator MprA